MGGGFEKRQEVRMKELQSESPNSHTDGSCAGITSTRVPSPNLKTWRTSLAPATETAPSNSPHLYCCILFCKFDFRLPYRPLLCRQHIAPNPTLSPRLGSFPTSRRLHTRLPQMDLWWHAGPPLGEMSSDSVSGRASRGSGSHPPNLSSASRSVRYNLIRVLSCTAGSQVQAPFQQA